MAELCSRTQNKLLSTKLMIANTFIKRSIGLLSKQKLIDDEMLWINPCNSIHTFFMRFSIDCVFLDKNMTVCSIRTQVSPWRMILPILKAHSVVEMNAGYAQKLNIQIGDELYVGN